MLLKSGIYIDASNISRSGGYAMRYDVLKTFVSRDSIPLRLNTYLAFDEERAFGEEDYEYREKQYSYHSALRNFGFKVITKAVKWFYNEEDNTRTSKCNTDLDMAVDILTQSRSLDKITILTGDGDFKRVIRAVQNMGIRVELIAFRNVSRDLIHEADQYISGYLIPNLLPIENQDPDDWGLNGSRVRGVCYALEKGYGFMRFMTKELDMKEVFFHFGELPEEYKVRVDSVLEFQLFQADQGWQAKEIATIW